MQGITHCVPILNGTAFNSAYCYDIIATSDTNGSFIADNYLPNNDNNANYLIFGDDSQFVSLSLFHILI
jgi:hypothetical protein